MCLSGRTDASEFPSLLREERQEMNRRDGEEGKIGVMTVKTATMDESGNSGDEKRLTGSPLSKQLNELQLLSLRHYLSL